MTWEEFEAMINAVANEGKEGESFTSNLVTIKKEVADLYTKHEGLEKEKVDWQEERKAMIDENRELFLQIPTSRTKSPEQQKQEETEEFEETVSISDIRRGRV